MSKPRTCSRCKRVLSETDFRLTYRKRDPEGTLSSWCKKCQSEYSTQWRRANKDKINARIKERYHLYASQMREPSKRYKVRLREQAIAAYGGKCDCCGESTYEFLGIDHVNNDGAAHRRELRLNGNKSIYLWLNQNGYPKEGFRLLCHNCNASMGYYGYCPHQKTP